MLYTQSISSRRSGFIPDTTASSEYCLCRSEALDDGETSAVAAKCYELCNAAANHITSIGKSWNSFRVNM